MLTTMDARDLSRLDKLSIDGRVSEPLTEEKLAEILRLHFQRTLPSRWPASCFRP